MLKMMILPTTPVGPQLQENDPNKCMGGFCYNKAVGQMFRHFEETPTTLQHLSLCQECLDGLWAFDLNLMICTIVDGFPLVDAHPLWVKAYPNTTQALYQLTPQQLDDAYEITMAGQLPSFLPVRS